jgi:MFS family permease
MVMEERHDPYGSLRFRDYRRLLTGSILATIATQMQMAALGWEIVQRMQDPRYLGWVGLVQFVPVLFLALPAGQAADHFSRKRLIVLAQGLIALAALGLATLSWIEGPLVLVYTCLLFTGLGRAFYLPARWAFIAQIVPLPLLANAVAWNSSGLQIALAVGPACGGALIALITPGGVYLLTATCAILCGVLVSTTRPNPQERSLREISLGSLLAGARFVWQTKPILATITLDLFAVLFGGATALIPVYAKDILEVGPVGYGWLLAAPALGAIVMALTLAHLPPLKRPGVALLWAVAGFGVAWIVFGLSESFTLSLIMLALSGALDNISVVVRGTLVQVLTPDSMRGRVSAVNSLFIGSSNELGAYESGETAHWFGPIGSVVGGGIATIGVVVAVMLLWPEVLRLGPLHKGGRREAAGETEVGVAESVGSGLDGVPPQIPAEDVPRQNERPVEGGSLPS